MNATFESQTADLISEAEARLPWTAPQVDFLAAESAKANSATFPDASSAS